MKCLTLTSIIFIQFQSNMNITFNVCIESSSIHYIASLRNDRNGTLYLIYSNNPQIVWLPSYYKLTLRTRIINDVK